MGHLIRNDPSREGTWSTCSAAKSKAMRLGWVLLAISGALIDTVFYYGREVHESEKADSALLDSIRAQWLPNWHRDARSDLYASATNRNALAVMIETVSVS